MSKIYSETGFGDRVCVRTRAHACVVERRVDILSGLPEKILLRSERCKGVSHVGIGGEHSRQKEQPVQSPKASAVC